MFLKSVKIIVFLVLLSQFWGVGIAGAAKQADIMGQVKAGGDKAGITTEVPIQQVIAEVITIFLSLVGIIFLALMIYAGYNLITARGEEEKAKKALDIIRASIIGLAIVLLAYGITYFIASGLQEAVNTGP